MNDVPVQEMIDILGVCAAFGRSRRAVRQAGEGVAGIGRIREPELRGMSQNISVEVEKIELRERCASSNVETGQFHGEARVVIYAELRGFRNLRWIWRNRLGKFGDLTDVRNVHDQQVLGALI